MFTESSIPVTPTKSLVDSVATRAGTSPEEARSAGEYKVKRFLWIIRGDEAYGFRRANLGIAAALRERSIEIGFVSMVRGTFSEEIAAAGFRLWFLDEFDDRELTRRKNGIGFISDCFRLFLDSWKRRDAVVQIIGEYNPDWIHVSINSLLIVGGAAAKKAQIPSFWHVHNTINSKIPFGLQPLGFRTICRLFDVFPLANSGHTADSLGWDWGPENIFYPGIDHRYFSNEGISSKPLDCLENLDLRHPTFLVAARIVEQKAQDRVLDAVIELLAEEHQISLIFVGGPLDSDYAESLLVRVKECEVGSSVHFVGTVDDVRPFFKMCDVVLNSRIDAEPFGLSVIEGMLMERPVLAYSLGGPSETIIDGETGWLTDGCSVADYKSSMIRVLKDKENWQKMGEKARQHAIANFSLEATIESYLSTINDRTAKS